MLPHEDNVRTEISTKYRTQLDGMTQLHNAVVGMMTGGDWTVTKPDGTSPLVAETMIGLLVKASKTFRSVQVLCERGLLEDASALVRMLLETSVVVAFILQKESILRARIYHTHISLQGRKTIDQWSREPVLAHVFSSEMLQRADQALAEKLEDLPSGIDVKSIERHWSGMANMREVMKALGEEVAYLTFYKYGSLIAHGGDFGGHLEIDEASGNRLWALAPTSDGFEHPSYAAREILWNTASCIDTRLGLGFASTLAPHKLSPADVTKGKQ